MDSDSDEEIPKVKVGDLEFPVSEVPSEAIEKMTPSEKDAYVQLYQEYMENLGNYLDWSKSLRIIMMTDWLQHLV